MSAVHPLKKSQAVGLRWRESRIRGVKEKLHPPVVVRMIAIVRGLQGDQSLRVMVVASLDQLVLILLQLPQCQSTDRHR